MQGSKIAALVAIAGVVGVCLVTISSEGLRYGAGEAWRRMSNDPGQACFDHVRSTLKDPFSARYTGLTAPFTEQTARIKYHAKNSFGAYDQYQELCVVYSSRVNITETEAKRKADGESLWYKATMQRLDQENRRMDRQNACLEEQIALMYKGIDNKVNCSLVR